MKKLIFINRFFYPDISATSQILTDLALALPKDKYQIYIICSRQLYLNSKSNLPKKESYKGIKIRRIYSTSYGRNKLYLRVIDYFSFYLSLMLILIHLPKKGDLIVAKTDPPLISVIVNLVSKFRKFHYINWLQDIFPEIAFNSFRNCTALNPLKLMRNLSLKNGYINIVLGDKMKEYIHQQGIPNNKIITIPNWCDGEIIRPIPHKDNQLRKEWGLSDKFVVGYSGNIGRVHEIDIILKCAKILKEHENIVFLFIGGGSKTDEIQKFTSINRLTNIQLKPYQPLDSLSYSLSLADLHITSLSPTYEGLVVPSKIYGILAVGRPILNIGSKSGEISKLISENNCGHTFSPEEHELAAKFILDSSLDYPKLLQLASNARTTYERCYNKKNSIKKWDEILQFYFDESEK